jgi:LPXTG-motif cell wall-anchored protein
MKKQIVAGSLAILASLAISLGGASMARAATCPTAPTDATSGVDWSGCDLSGWTFTSQTLDSANLSGANLTGATFDSTSMMNVNLSGANLTNVTFTNSYLFSAIITGANLTGTSLVGEQANQTNGITSGSVLQADGVQLSPGWKVIAGYLIGPVANLVGVDLSGLDLTGVSLYHTLLMGANLTGANLAGVDLTGAYASGVNFTDANLTNAVVGGADFGNATFDGATVDGVDFSGAVNYVPAATPSPTSEVPVETLADTGANVDPALWFGLLLLFAGGVFVLVSRKR